MPTFALIAEGKTDQIVLERIIEQVCGEAFEEDVEATFLQPLRDATDAHTAPHAGWGLVLEYCRLRTSEALANNDYVVIQIDTDCGDEENFNLELTKDGVERDFSELVADAAGILIDHIGKVLYEDNRARIILAVAVHSIESWLLLILFDDGRTKSSFDKLRHTLNKKNMGGLAKDVQHYKGLVKLIKKKKLAGLAGGETSLGIFLSRLEEACVSPEIELTQDAGAL